MAGYPNQPPEPLGFKEGFELLRILGDDLSRTVALLQERDDDFTRRLAVRVTFSTIEGYLSVLKGRALSRMKYGHVVLNRKALDVLEERREVDGEWRVWYPPTGDNLKVTLRSFASAFGQDTYLETNPIPDAFWAAHRARNRVTHPKRSGDMTITDDEKRATQETLKWVVGVIGWSKQTELDEIARVRSEINRSVGDQIRELREGIERHKRSK